MNLHGQRVTLRAITAADLPTYVAWLADPDVVMYLGATLPFALENEQTWFQAQLNDPSQINYAIELDGRHIGGAGLMHISGQNQNAEVGLFIGEKSLWDQGLGRDALATIVSYGFDYLNLHRIYLRVFAQNLRAVHAYERLGFVHEGRFRQAEWRHGQWQDVLYMSVLRDEWRHPRAHVAQNV